ncbi:MAG: hypothetical protein HY321_02415 [Armatimonadetes bacterium]|nr:hypothetical protein [Armatimonadota bacterium]
MTSDAELVERTREGDMSAFEEIVRRYQAQVYGLAWHLTGSFTDAQDIAQEVFIAAAAGMPVTAILANPTAIDEAIARAYADEPPPG